MKDHRFIEDEIEHTTRALCEFDAIANPTGQRELRTRARLRKALVNSLAEFLSAHRRAALRDDITHILNAATRYQCGRV